MLLTEHGKHIVEFCNTSAAKRPLFFQHLYRRGVQKIENRIPTEHGKQKKICFIRSMGSIFSSFATPLERFAHFFDHEVVTNSVPVELGGGIYIYKE